MKQSNTSFKLVGSRFEARGAATEKALSPIFWLVLGTTKSVIRWTQQRPWWNVYRSYSPSCPRSGMLWSFTFI